MREGCVHLCFPAHLHSVQIIYVAASLKRQGLLKVSTRLGLSGSLLQLRVLPGRHPCCVVPDKGCRLDSRLKVMVIIEILVCSRYCGRSSGAITLVRNEPYL